MDTETANANTALMTTVEKTSEGSAEGGPGRTSDGGDDGVGFVAGNGKRPKHSDNTGE